MAKNKGNDDPPKKEGGKKDEGAKIIPFPKRGYPCVSCGGTGQKWMGHRFYACGGCGGTGRQR